MTHKMTEFSTESQIYVIDMLCIHNLYRDRSITIYVGYSGIDRKL